MNSENEARKKIFFIKTNFLGVPIQPFKTVVITMSILQVVIMMLGKASIEIDHKEITHNNQLVIT